jgi:hypothetical protein
MNNRDYEYENNNRIYEDPDTYRIKCIYHELCLQSLPLDHYKNHKKYICDSCKFFKIKKNDFFTCDENDDDNECPICMEKCNKQLFFPAYCGHSFCLKCSRKLLFKYDCFYYLSPEPYGCSPCPNGCVNPLVGEQCFCREYLIKIDEWKLSNPSDYMRWNEDEEESIFRSYNTDNYYGSQECPICRSKIY